MVTLIVIGILITIIIILYLVHNNKINKTINTDNNATNAVNSVNIEKFRTGIVNVNNVHNIRNKDKKKEEFNIKTYNTDFFNFARDHLNQSSNTKMNEVNDLYLSDLHTHIKNLKKPVEIKDIFDSLTNTNYLIAQ